MAAERTYDRTWEEIETMLGRAEKKMRKWKDFFVKIIIYSVN